jgi:hypothetical protein
MQTKALFLIFEHTPDGWRYAHLVNSPFGYPQMEAERVARNMSALMPMRLYSVQHGRRILSLFLDGQRFTPVSEDKAAE